MKKSFLLGIGIVALVANLSSCKKGENDPFLSLKSRKSRVVGEWTLSKIVGTETYVDLQDATNNYTTEISYADGKETTTEKSSGTPFSTVKNYTMDYSFKKDGTYTIIKTTTTNTTTSVNTLTGTWVFIGKNKTDGIKKKEGILLNETSNTTASNGISITSSSTGLSNNSSIMLFDQLKSKEIVIIDDYSQNWPGQTDVFTNKLTLTAK
jgi:hypothetical protein